jgi:hypothetical protein
MQIRVLHFLRFTSDFWGRKTKPLDSKWLKNGGPDPKLHFLRFTSDFWGRKTKPLDSKWLKNGGPDTKLKIY